MGGVFLGKTPPSERKFRDFLIFVSASSNRWTVPASDTGSLLCMLDRISIIFMKNKKVFEKYFLKNIFFDNRKFQNVKNAKNRTKKSKMLKQKFSKCCIFCSKFCDFFRSKFSKSIFQIFDQIFFQTIFPPKYFVFFFDRSKKYFKKKVGKKSEHIYRSKISLRIECEHFQTLKKKLKYSSRQF